MILEKPVPRERKQIQFRTRVLLYVRNIITMAVSNQEFVANELMIMNNELQRIWKECDIVGTVYHLAILHM